MTLEEDKKALEWYWDNIIVEKIVIKRIFKDNKEKMFIYLKKSFDKRKVV